MKTIATIAGLAAALAFSTQVFADTVELGSATGSVSQSASLGMGNVVMVDIAAGVAAAAVIAAVVAGASDNNGSTSTSNTSSSTSPTTSPTTTGSSTGT